MKSKGYTLIELILVVAIISIVASSAIVLITPNDRTISTKKSAEKFISHLHYVQETAIANNTNAGIYIVKSEKKYFAQIQDISSSSFETLQLPHNGQSFNSIDLELERLTTNPLIVNDTVKLMFSPWGLSDRDSELAFEFNSTTFTVHGITGFVE